MSVAVGFGLLPIVTLRPAREIVVATVLLFVAFVVTTLATTPITSDTGPQQIAVISLAVLPSAVATLVLQRFRRMVQVELDRVLVQSNVSQPRFAVGMLASDELARLDLAAEKLLDGVAGGDVPLPLAPKVASQAASLATELRLHLIEGRRETWLHHAVTESEYLGRSVTLADPSSLAGLLAPRSATVCCRPSGCCSATRRAAPRHHDHADPRARDRDRPLARRAERRDPRGGHHDRHPPEPRHPATWSALERVGEYTVSTHEQSVRLQVSCLVDYPAES